MKHPLLTVAFVAALTASPAPAVDATPPPNIVVFLVDDMGVMDSSVPFLTDASGTPKRYPLNDFYRTPAMENLAAKGVRFNNFCAMSVCSPTRVSIMTGQNAARHHTTNWINPDRDNAGKFGPPDWNWSGLTKDSVTLPGLLSKAGYHTIHVGKGHFGARKFAGADPANLGFDVNIAGASFGAPGSYYADKNYGGIGKRKSHAVPGLEKYHGTDTFLTEALTIEANAELTRTVKAGKPFYLYMAHYAVHAPFDSDPRFASHYADADKPANAKAFATLIEGMDKSLGDLLIELDELGVADNTLVLFMGDNGSDAPLGDPHAVAFAAPLRGKKGSHYEGGMRVPFIAAWAKADPANPHQKRLPIPADTIQPRIASVVDIFPTVLGVTGVEAPAGHTVDGRPLDKLLIGKPDPDRPDTFLMNYPHSPHRSEYFTSYRDGDWKVVYHYRPSKQSGGSHYQLFNLADDPFESTDRAKTKPAELTAMMGKLIASMERHDGQYPLADDGKTPLTPKMP